MATNRNASVVVVVVVVVVAVACGGRGTPAAPPPSADLVLIATDADGVAVGGYDPVAYRSDGAPRPGADAHAATHDGADYWFASAPHHAMFEADPARFAPGYGGYCAYAVSQGRLTAADPEVWAIVDDRLLLFASQDVHDRFAADPTAHRRAADDHWPSLVGAHGRPR
jgi:YHS domain-containing protein